jgi:hypothetical protein
MDETLIADCHRAILRARFTHPSPHGYELLMHPSLKSFVCDWEEASWLRHGSFGTLVGALRIVYTLGAGPCFALFCRTHMHRLDELTGAPDTDAAAGDGTIAP